MSQTITSAAPRTIFRGVKDDSTKEAVYEAEAIPSHLPFICTYAKEGPCDLPQLVVGSSMTRMFGTDSFDIRKKWATHASVLINKINARGNQMMIKRVKPLDANDPATIRISIDVLPTNIPIYETNSDGSFKTDDNNNYIETGEHVAGFKTKWVVGQVTVDQNNISTFGSANQVAGDQVDIDTKVQSTRYPILDLVVSNFGDYGNNIGLRMWAPTTETGGGLDTRILENNKAYPFRFACVRRDVELSTVNVVATLSGEQYVNAVLPTDMIDKNTDALISFNDVFIAAFQNLLNNDGSPAVYGPFGKAHLYSDNLETLIKQFYAAEYPLADSFSDFTGEANEENKFNIISGVSSQNVPYKSFQIISNTSNSVRFTEGTTIYASGGSDGTMNEALFAKLVSDEMNKFADENSVYQDDAKYPVSIFYDSGFPLETKYNIIKFISVRKDTAVVLSTHDVLGQVLTATQESALAVALRTRLQMYPESEYFGTPTMRGLIVGRCGTLINSQYRKKLPLTIEIADKAAQYMGASDGIWKSEYRFDRAPRNNVSLFKDINVTFTPVSVRNKDWSNGLIWVDNFDLKSVYFPALKTVYDDDTSVLNSFFTMMGCVELTKIGARSQRQFSGSSDLTDDQFVDEVNKYITNSVKDRFDDRFKIIPDTYYTAADVARGYSWVTNIKIGAPSMKTVGVLQITAYRTADLTDSE